MFNKIKENKLFFCFFVPFIFIMIYEILLLVLGDFTLLSNDAYYQYISFYESFYQKVREGSSLFYTLKGAFGTDFYAIYTYYLSSPINFLMFLFPKGYIAYYLTFIIGLKLSLCGLSMGYYLKNKYNTSKYLILYSCIWTFCGYMTGYCWNIMWFDVIILMPLILLSMDDLIYKKDIKKYTLLLSIAIFCNYFMGFILCIFLFFRFFTMKFKNVKDFFFSGFRFAICSIISALMSCIILVPSYIALTSTSISKEKLTDVPFALWTNFYNIFRKLMFGVNPNAIVNTSYNANLYVSLFVILTFFIYLFTRKISIVDKLRNIFLIVFLVISLNNRFLNFIWHGFHKQNGIPNRFVFLITFLLICCSYEIVIKLGEINLFEKILGFVSTIVLYFLIYSYDKSLKYNFIMSICLITTYFLFLIWDKVSCFIIFVEIFIFFIFGSVYSCLDNIKFLNYYYDDFEEINEKYDNEYYRETFPEFKNFDNEEAFNIKASYFCDLENIFDFVKNFKNMLNDFKDIGYKPTSNEEMYFNLDSLSLFNTFTNNGLATLSFKTGNTGSSNTIRYSKDNVIEDILFGVKYKYLPTYFEPYNTNFIYNYVDTIGNINVYENKYALSLGYLIRDNVDSNVYDMGDQFEVLNNLCFNICGVTPFVERDAKITEVLNCKITNDNIYYPKYERTNKERPIIAYEYVANTDSDDYLYVHCNDLYSAKIYINNELILENNISQNMIEIGDLKVGDKVRVELTIIAGDVSGGFNFFLYSLKKEFVEEIYNRLAQNQLNITSYKAGYLEGDIKKVNGDNLLLTIPYDDNWEITINGDKVKADKFADAFMYINLQNGDNHIVMKYVNRYFYYGLGLSILGFIMYFGMNLFYKKNKNKIKN